MHAYDAVNLVAINPSDLQGHGTHMASVAAGNYAGVAKAANIVSVKKNQYVIPMSRGIGMILNDVATNGFKGRAVINMSFG